MECCCYPIDVYDQPSVYRMGERVARAQHVCCECGGTIGPGQRYEYVTGCYDGSWRCFKTCIGCRNLRSDLACGGGYLHEGLSEAVFECFGFHLGDDPSELEDDDE